jgi:MarR family transcriptional regulator, organic hydroperoxide resistance regulator
MSIIKSSKTITPKQATVCGTFRSTWLVISRMYNLQAEAYGGNISIAYYLLNIDSNTGAYATDIAMQLGVESTGLARMTKKLEDEKMIIRTIDKQDKRKVIITLTAKGQKAKQTAKDAVRNFNTELKTVIGEKELISFFNVAQQVQQIAEQKLVI